MYKIIYGTDTKSIEDYGQCVVVLVPEDMDYEILEQELDEDFDSFKTQTIVTMEDVIESLALILDAEGVDPMRTISALQDALDNND